MSSENGRVSSGTRLVEGREGDKAPTGGDRRAVKEPHVGTNPVATYAGQLDGAGREIAHVNIRVIVNHIVRDQVSGGEDEGKTKRPSPLISWRKPVPRARRSPDFIARF